MKTRSSQSRSPAISWMSGRRCCGSARPVRRIPDRKRRDELALAFTMGAFGDPDVLKDKPDFDELIHSDKEGEE